MFPVLLGECQSVAVVVGLATHVYRRGDIECGTVRFLQTGMR